MRFAAALSTAFVVAAIGAAPASATVTSGVDAFDSLFASSDGAADTIAITCSGGLIKVNGLDPGGVAVACSVPQGIDIYGGGGADVLDITGVDQVEWSALTFTSVDGGVGDPDDGADTLRSGIDGPPGLLRGGDGNDLIVAGSGTTVEGGPGDDRIEGFGGVGALLDGGDGLDAVAIDIAAGPPTDLTFIPTDGGVTYGSTGGSMDSADWTDVERFDAALNDGAQHVDAAGFSGSVHLDGRGGADSLTGGALADELHGGAGTDVLEGGDGTDVLDGGAGTDTLDGGEGDDTLEGAGGADDYSGGEGDDLLRARDDIADGGDCGAGTDALIADVVDTVAGCEVVDLPQGPPEDPPDPGQPDPPAPGPLTSSTPPDPGVTVPTPRKPITGLITRHPAAVTPGWSVRGKRTTITRLRIANAVTGTVLQLRCSGSKCPFTTKRTTKARKGVIDGLALLGKPANAELRAGQTLEVRVTAPNRLGTVIRFLARKGKQPKRTVLCLPVGKTKPQAHC